MSEDILSLGGRVALVTGAGQGVGRQVAIHLSEHNCGGVAVNDYHLSRAEAVVEEIRAAGGKAIAVQADVTDFEAVKAMVAKTELELGTIGVLVNNAGNMGANPTADARKPFWETGPEVWNQAIGVNFYGVLNAVSAVIPGMIARKAPAQSSPSSPTPGASGTAGLRSTAGPRPARQALPGASPGRSVDTTSPPTRSLSPRPGRRQLRRPTRIRNRSSVTSAATSSVGLECRPTSPTWCCSWLRTQVRGSPARPIQSTVGSLWPCSGRLPR